MPWSQAIQFHQFLFAPNGDPADPSIIKDCNNFYPTAAGARKLRQLQSFGPALPKTVLGAFLAQYTNLTPALPGETPILYCGTQDHLYVLVRQIVGLGDVLVWNINDTASPVYNAGGSRWRFAQFLNDVIATDGNDPVQYSNANGAFAALPGSPPNAKIVVSADPGGTGAFALLFNLSGNPSLFADQWACSAPGNDKLWSFLPSDQSATARLASEPGDITAAHALGTSVIVYKRKAMYVGTYIGGNAVWDFAPVSAQVGTWGNECVVDLGDAHAFIGPDNFYITYGGPPTPIPNLLWNRFRNSDLVTLPGAADFANIQNCWAAYDQSFDVCYWYYPSLQANPVGSIDSWISWHRASGRWLIGKLNIECAIHDQVPYPYEDLAFGPRSEEPSYRGVFTSADHVVQLFSQPDRTRGYLRTNSVGSDTRISSVQGLQPRFLIYPQTPPPGGIAGSEANLITYIKDKLGNVPVQNSGLLNINRRGIWNFRQSARWHEFQLETYSDSEIEGYLVDIKDAGER